MNQALQQMPRGTYQADSKMHQVARASHRHAARCCGLVLALLVQGCADQPVAQQPARYGEAYRAAMRAQTLQKGQPDDLRPTARELGGAFETVRGQNSQETISAPSTAGGGSGGR